MGDNSIWATATACARRCNGRRDRNGGFSRADPAALVLPPIMDPLYGYRGGECGGAVARSAFAAELAAAHAGGAAQAPRLRPRRHPLPARRRTARCWPICASMRAKRSCASPTCRARRRRSSWTCREFAGRTPVELSGGAAFPHDRPAHLSADLAALRLLLVRCSARTRSRRPGARPPPGRAAEHHTFVLRNGLGGSRWRTARPRDPARTKCCRAYIAQRRWFQAKDTQDRSVQIVATGAAARRTSRMLAVPISTSTAGERPAATPCRMAIAWEDEGVQSLRGAAGAWRASAAAAGSAC